ncbi:PREDICTED: uncharacterized protein LOC108367773 [Rhagoletis zephyria]|uniref:uncharacterized protein LOC108367773 n=1 Tax=Rhagoletis zephyria TaxID=28612 RepID=UPI0008116335|nr:PREDICTED: uncharacterized protein LOC108367773 [Rhagoletis zephyria]
MANQNGQLILQTLQNLEEPVTVSKIVTHIAVTAGVHPNEVKESVKETLNGGVRYGFIQRSQRKYYAAPVDLDMIVAEEAGELEPKDNKDNSEDSGGELEDRGMRRRKRRAARSRSRSRRGSRRRRRR